MCRNAVLRGRPAGPLPRNRIGDLKVEPSGAKISLRLTFCCTDLFEIRGIVLRAVVVLKNCQRSHFSGVLVSFSMNIDEYAKYDALGLAELVSGRHVAPRELAETAARAIEAINPAINAIVETYPDRIDSLDEKTLGDGPFRGVPFLMKDVFGHEAGRRIEFGSRLCRGMIAQTDTHLCELFRASGLNILGRSAAPEYSMSGTTESVMFGNTSTPWKHGYSAGGSTGGGMAAVMAGMVPIAHGSDIAGSIRIPASFCGGVGLKPSRGRVSFGPMVDENGYGLGQNLVQTKSVRDAAAMLDCLAVPQIGYPFPIPRPEESYAALSKRNPPA